MKEGHYHRIAEDLWPRIYYTDPEVGPTEGDKELFARYVTESFRRGTTESVLHIALMYASRIPGGILRYANATAAPPAHHSMKVFSPPLGEQTTKRLGKFVDELAARTNPAWLEADDFLGDYVDGELDPMANYFYASHGLTPFDVRLLWLAMLDTAIQFAANEEYIEPLSTGELTHVQLDPLYWFMQYEVTRDEADTLLRMPPEVYAAIFEDFVAPDLP